MPTLDTLTNPIKAVIYKKTLDNGQTVYVPYLPRTDAEWVSLNEEITVHGTEYAANTDLETVIKALNASIGAPNAATSSATSASLQAQINYISQELISKSGAFVYKRSTTAQTTAEAPLDFCYRVLGGGTQPVAGWVFNISNNFKIDANGQLIASDDHDAYRGGTNIVIIGSGTASDPFKFDALGGDMGNHALTSEAIGSATLNGNTITFTHVNNTTAGTITFSTIGTIAASTTAITTTITSASSNAIPTEGAVYNYASSAGQVKVTAATEGYLIGVATYSAADSSTARPPLDFNIHVTGGKGTTPTLGADISGKATTAGTADKVSHSFTVAGQTFDGLTTKTVSVGNGLTATINGNTTTVSVQVVSNGALSNGTTGVDLNTVNTIAEDAVYSAIQVDKYGRAKAGAQAVIFAKGLNDPDLADLVVGGLAFIGTSTAAASTYTQHVAASSESIGIMDDAE